MGVLLSLWATQALSAFQLPVPIPVDMRIGVDWRVLVFTFALSILSGLLLGVAPAWAAARPLLGSALKGEDALARPGRRWTLRNLLTVAQIAMSVILLSMTGLFLRSLETRGQHRSRLSPAGPAEYVGRSTASRLHAGADGRVSQSVAGARSGSAGCGLGGVHRYSAALHGWRSQRQVPSLAAGQTPAKTIPSANLTMVTPGYFETMGIPRVAGRDFGGETASGPKTAVVNRAFVERVFGRGKSHRAAGDRRRRDLPDHRCGRQRQNHLPGRGS